MSIRHDPIKSRLIRNSTVFLLLLGAAIGFGNIWRFPMLVGQYGGSAFILVYGVFTLLLGVPLMMTELGMGRSAGRNPVDTVAIYCKKSDTNFGWKAIGIFAVIASLIVLSFYSVIGGMGMAYIFYSAFGEFNNLTLESVTNTVVELRKSPGVLVVWHSLFLVIVSVIVSRGVRNGVGRAARMLVPIMFIVALAMLFHVSSKTAFSQSYDYLFQFAWDKLTWRGLLEALSHSFFTLTIGLGAIMAIGTYTPERVSIPMMAVGVAVADMVFALIAGLVILTLLFTHGQTPQQGFGLLFQVIPWLMGNEEFGQFWGAAFFVLVTFAAWTSAIALSEPFVIWLVEKTTCTRRFASAMLAISAWLIGCMLILSLSEWKDLRLAGLTLFGFMDFLTSRFLIPVGGLLLALFIGVRMQRSQLENVVLFKYRWMFVVWYFNVRWFVPGAILLVFVFGILKFTESTCRATTENKNYLCAVMAEPEKDTKEQDNVSTQPESEATDTNEEGDVVGESARNDDQSDRK